MINFYEYTSLNGQLIRDRNEILYTYKGVQYFVKQAQISSYVNLAHRLGIDGFEILFSLSRPGDLTLLAKKTIVPQQPFGELEERLNEKIETLKNEFIAIGESVIITNNYELWKDEKRERIIFNYSEAKIEIKLPRTSGIEDKLKDWVFYFCWVKGGKPISFNNDIHFNQAGSLHKKKEFLPNGDGTKSTTLKITFLEDIGYFLID